MKVLNLLIKRASCDFGRIKAETRTIDLYEAPHKLVKTLEELSENLGDRKIALCR